MPILFLLTYILLTYYFLRIKKSSHKLNILLWITISIIIYMCFNSVVIYILYLLKIKGTLLIRSIINIILSIIIMFFTSEKQKYYFNKYDLISLIILLYTIFLIVILRFGVKLNLAFEMNDAALHFAFAKKFATINTIINNTKLLFIPTQHNTMFFSYTNAGTLIQLLMPITGKINMYKSFIIFESISLYLSGILLYFIISKKIISIKKYFFTIVLVILYLLGYPLLNMIYGFHYWGLIILVISTIIIVIQEFVYKKMYNSKIIILTLFLLTTSVFTTYYLYVPVVYLSLALYFIYLWKCKKIITFKKSLLYISITLVIPFIFGMIYYDFINEYFLKKITETNMNIDGDTYKNILGNYIYLIPVIIYAITVEFKKKKINIVTMLAIVNFIYMIILFIFCIKGIMSNYYFAKIYNLAWLITYIYLIKVIVKNKKLFINIYLYNYILIVLLAIFQIEGTINHYKNNITSSNIIIYLGDIYDKNIGILKNGKPLINDDINKLLVKIDKEPNIYKNKNGEIPMITNYMRKLWISQILEIIPAINYKEKKDVWNNYLEDIDKSNDTKYFIWIPNVDEQYDNNYNKYDIIYKNNYAVIFKKNNN